LVLKKQYYCIKYSWAIYHTSRKYFSFGNNLYIYNNCRKNTSNYLGFPSSYNIPKNFELNGGKDHFAVKSYEVYEIEN